ncbi:MULTISPECIES: LacI family DNA-binding transcriptional regulator [Serratia]|uniref:LacI family DNA-binding transcriptional regulator n=1 Tax=Serratia TaxID=613 RepID=UPI002A5A702B|nr:MULTISPECIES: LacI family DNA-binding transcriptional regulator [Serratia]MDY0768504.1 LacI family DNA-binding transcriptional regulator [Serratia nevei]MED6027231.1 LacI family DNA-binding transcriptional regulator [Serratia marcescens]
MTDLLSVARLAGVSRATAARAFSEPEKVRQTTRERVFSASQQLGFRPNYVARQLRTQSTCIIGVMVPTLSNPLFSEQLQEMETVARAAGYSLMIATTDYDPERELAVLENMLRQRVDGLVLTVADARQSASLTLLEKEPLPVVLVHNPVASAHFVTVSVDNQQAMYQATQHLLTLGHTRIGMLSGPVQQSDRAQLRYQGYRQAMIDSRHLPLPLIEMPHHTRVEAAPLRRYFDTDGELTALICSNDLLALSAIGALSRLGYHVPEDISVVGFDGIALGEMVSPSLCSVVQPTYELGHVATQSLLRLISGEKVASRVLDFILRPGESIARVQH